LTRLQQEGDDHIVDANKKVPEDETALPAMDAEELPFSAEQRLDAAKKIDYIIERDESVVESIGHHGYMPGIIDIQCNLTALEAERDALKAEREEWKHSNLENWWTYHPRPASFDMNQYALDLEHRVRWLELGVSCSREDRKVFKQRAELAESKLAQLYAVVGQETRCLGYPKCDGGDLVGTEHARRCPAYTPPLKAGMK
jgi:ribosomal protein S16